MGQGNILAGCSQLSSQPVLVVQYKTQTALHALCQHWASHHLCNNVWHVPCRLIQEKQELMADLINANQAFIRLQADHTALLQKVSGANLPAQAKQQLCADAAGVQDISTAAHAPQLQQHKAAPAGLDLSTMVTNLLKSEGPASPAAAAAVAEEDTCPVEGLGTPRLEPGSSPVKRQRKRWSQTAPLRKYVPHLSHLTVFCLSLSISCNISWSCWWCTRCCGGISFSATL